MLLLKVLIGILGISIVILTHEAGHFLAARLTGIRIQTFSIGFGRKILGFKTKETDYRISILPLGGYCRFYGEDAFKTALDNKLDAIPTKAGDFYSSAPWKRIVVCLSGPLANILFAIVVMSGIYLVGFQEKYTDPRIILASEYSDDGVEWPADKAGLKSGDLIVKIQGQTINKFQQIRQLLVFRPGRQINMTIERDGRLIDQTIVPDLDKENALGFIGVYNWIDPVIADILPDSAAWNIFEPGDRILSIDGQPVAHTVGFFNLIKDRNKDAMHIEVRRNNTKHKIDWTIGQDSILGITFQYQESRSEKLNVFQSIQQGIQASWDTLTSTMLGIRMMFMGIKINNAIAGPIRLISETGSTLVQGFQNGIGPGFLMAFRMMSLISISLAFLNLLPIPVLDGGQILLFAVEWVRKNPIKPHAIFRYQTIGTIIVAIIAIMATTGDMLHFFNGVP